MTREPAYRLPLVIVLAAAMGVSSCQPALLSDQAPQGEFASGQVDEDLLKKYLPKQIYALISFANDVSSAYNKIKTAIEITQLFFYVVTNLSLPTEVDKFEQVKTHLDSVIAGLDWKITLLEHQHNLSPQFTALELAQRNGGRLADTDSANSASRTAAGNATGDGIFLRTLNEAATDGPWKARIGQRPVNQGGLVYDWRMGLPAMMQVIALRLQVLAAVDPDFPRDRRFNDELASYQQVLLKHYYKIKDGVACSFSQSPSNKRSFSLICADIHTGYYEQQPLTLPSTLTDAQLDAAAYTQLSVLRKSVQSQLPLTAITDMIHSLIQYQTTEDVGISSAVSWADFDSDGLADLALTGPAGWTSVPVAKGQSDGSFRVFNQPFTTTNFGGWSVGARKLIGDFDGDGRTDIALTGPINFASIPVAFAASDDDGNNFGDFWVVNRMSTSFDRQNRELSDFPGWAATPDATKLVGDFNGDRRSDVALVGAKGWASIPVAFSEPSTGGLAFRITNASVTDFATWAASTAEKFAGDFNNDGKTDIALIGGPNWTSVPVALSNGDGTFTIKNQPVTGFGTWAQTCARKVLGDFDGRNGTDIALVGGPGWTSMPVAFSNGDGTFTIRNEVSPDFATWAQSKATILSGDFNADGKNDLALAGGPGWTSIPVALSRGDGRWTVVNSFVGDFGTWADTNATKVVGNFDGRGGADVALVGGPAWTSVPVALSNGDGTFSVTNHFIGDFGSWASASPVKIVQSR